MNNTMRKSSVQTPVESKRYRAAAYVRLSAVKPNEQNDSIENQKDIIKNFIASRPDIQIANFYVDENTSGSSVDRKAFEEMTDDISSGKIDCIVVKDLSRFGRNSIEVSFYIQHLFPQKEIRFISILDRFDTLDGITDISFDGNSSIRITMLNIFNEEYVADIKRKTQASIDANIREGKLVAAKAPYGYIKSPDDCHSLIIDPEAASVVKEIFSMAERKISLNEIVRRLNLAHIPTPIDYALSKGLQGNYERGNGSWNSRSVKYILTNRTYAGDLQQGKDGIIVEDTHETLVPRDLFLALQDSYFKASTYSDKQSQSKLTDNPLRGKVICGSCGGKMQRRKGSSGAGWYFFSCITNNRKGHGCETGMYIRESEIMDKIKAEFIERNNVSGILNRNEWFEIIEQHLLNVVVYEDKHLDVLTHS